MKIKPENRFWIGIYGFTACIMLIAMGVFGWLAWTSKEEPGVGRVAGTRLVNNEANPLPEEEYEKLAAFAAPAWVPEPRATAPFQAAMVQYKNQKYRDAATALRAVSDAQPGFAAAQFDLGVSLLLAGDRIAGIQELRALADQDKGPYVERARFYLAKGLIAEHDLRRARDELKAVISLHGGLEKQATTLLGQIHES